MIAVALIGPDGSGKTTIARRLEREVGVPARYLYMGVSPDASNRMLPTTRLALAVKSAAMPDVLSGKDLLQGNGLSQAGGALFQVVGLGFALGAAAVFPAWLVVVIGAGVLVVSAVVAQRMRHAEAREHATSFGAEARQVVRNIVAGVREIAARPPAAARTSLRSQAG